MPARIGFNRNMLSFLVAEGYTHIYSKGIIDNSNEYILIPLEPGDPRLQYEELNKIVEAITSNDVYDMADGDEFINFYIELQDEDFRK